MSYENLNANQLRDECRERGLKISGTKSELIQRLYEDDENIENSHSSNASTDNFSFAGLIVAILFGYIAYKFFPIVKGVHNIYNYLGSDDFLAQFLSKFLESSTNGRFQNMFSFFHIWFWTILISYVIKTIIALNHSFSPSQNNISYIGWTAMILEVLPIFFKIWSINSFEDALQIMLIVYIPTIIGIALIYSKEIFD
jgi:hypothetical protein